MAGAGGASVLHVVEGDGSLNAAGVQGFMREAGVESAGVDYTIVAIMGPQSSGKSTLLNHLFGTRFEEMDALSGRRQTTHGIWLARSPKVEEPTTLVMDLEGSDGRERGEDDTSFERQSALFALAVADVVLVNMWAKDVGRESGAGKPLLKTIFQARQGCGVNLKLFQPAPNRRRTVLLFVFRDRTKTPLEKLIETWETDLLRMWEGITKPPQYEAASFNDFFDVQYAALSNYEDRQEEFLAESVILRRRFAADEPDTFLRPSEEKLPGHALALSMEKVWEVVREHKDLNLPAHRVMVANIRCGEILADQLEAFTRDQAWRALADEAGQDLVPAFGQRTAALMDSCMAGYDEEARYFEPHVSQAKAEELQEALDGLVRPAFDAQLAILRELTLTLFKQQLQARARGERLSARAHLERDIAAHTNEVRLEHVGAALAAAEAAAAKDVSAAALALLEAPPPDLWPRLGAALGAAARRAAGPLDAALAGYGLSAEELDKLHARLARGVRARLVSHAREAANTALSRVKDRFNEVFQRDEAGLPRTWQPGVDVPAVTAAARRAAAQLLAQLVVVRLGGEGGGGAAAGRDGGGSAPPPSPKNLAAIDAAVLALAEPAAAPGGEGGARARAPPPGGFDLQAAAEWPGVGEGDALLSPGAARAVWRSFASDSTYAVQQALATQEANRAAANRTPPLWAIAAMVVLGFNEFLAVLYNPLWLLLLLVLFLFGKTVYQELDVEAEMERGLLPGAVSLSAKFLPTLHKVAGRVVESGMQLLQDGPQAAPTRGGGSGGGDGGAARREHDGLRQRRREEAELELSESSHGTRVARAGGSDSGSKDD
eukprot:scaffold6.g2604.t1